MEQQKIAQNVVSANAVIVNPQAGCECYTLQHSKQFKAISNATVVSPREKNLMSPHYYVREEVLLSTANVLIREPSGSFTECRALLDSGSQVSFISRACAAKLNLEAKLTHLHVASVAVSNVERIRHSTKITLRSSHDPAFSCETEAYVVPEVTGHLPTISFVDATQMWPHLHLLRLADPGYNLSREIDLLLGADCFPSIMRSEVRRGIEGQPMAQATVFGWVLLGPVTLKVELMQQSQQNGQEEENGTRPNFHRPGNSSSRPRLKVSDRHKHFIPGSCWFREWTIYQSSLPAKSQQDSTKQ